MLIHPKHMASLYQLWTPGSGWVVKSEEQAEFIHDARRDLMQTTPTLDLNLGKDI